MTEIQKLKQFIDAHPDAKCDGFFWCEELDDYRCTVVASIEPRRSVRQVEGAEFRGATAEELCAAALSAGLDLGDVAGVAHRCETAGRSRRRRRKVG